MKIQAILPLSLAFTLALGACQNKDDEPQNGGGETPAAKAHEALRLALPTGAKSLTLSGATADEAQPLFIDLNGDGKLTEGEAITAESKAFALPGDASSLVIYGVPSSLNLAGQPVSSLTVTDLAKLTELNISGTQLPSANLVSLIEALPTPTASSSPKVVIDESQRQGQFVQIASNKHWTLQRADGTTIDPTESTMNIRLVRAMDKAQYNAVLMRFTGARSMWVDRNLNGKQDADEALPTGSLELSLADGEQSKLFVLHGTGSILEMETVLPPDPDDDDDSDDDDSDAASSVSSARALRATTRAQDVPFLIDLDVNKFAGLLSISVDPLNGLRSIDAAYAPALTTIRATNNPVESLTLPKKDSKFTSLTLNNASLTELDLSDQKLLQTVSLTSNDLTKLTLGEAGNLSTLDLSGNKLASLELPALPAILRLDLSGNQLTSLTLKGEVNKQVTYLRLQNNQLTTIDLSGFKQKVQELRLDKNPLTTAKLPGDINKLNVSGTKLAALDLSANQFLVSLDASGIAELASLKLFATSTTLETLNLGNCPALTAEAILEALPKVSGVKTLRLESGKLSADQIRAAREKGWSFSSL